jgi:hypothetical protein
VAGADGQRIMRVIDELNRELGSREELSELESRGERSVGEPVLGRLDEEGEDLVAGVRDGLARLAATAGGAAGEEDEGAAAVGAALSGVELVMRGEILLGNGERLEAMVPSFAFLATLPTVGKEQAVALAQRAEELLADL